MTRAPTFLFCVGATKAGTSWLFDHLSQHEECHFRSIKELHYFGRSEPADFEKALRENKLEIDQMKADGQDHAPHRRACRLADLRDWRKVLQRRMIDLPAYSHYLTKGIGQAHVVGDVTPAYSLLGVDKLKRLLDVGTDVRVLYLIRDPLARLWSHVRMVARRMAPNGFADEAPRLFARIIQGSLDGQAKGIVARGNYAAILPKLARVFDPRRLLVQFYEDLMQPEGVARMSAFLGIAPGEGQFGRRIHAGQALAMAPAARARALAYLKPQYDYVASQFGTIPEAWRANMNEGVA